LDAACASARKDFTAHDGRAAGLRPTFNTGHSGVHRRKMAIPFFVILASGTHSDGLALRRHSELNQQKIIEEMPRSIPQPHHDPQISPLALQLRSPFRPFPVREVRKRVPRRQSLATLRSFVSKACTRTRWLMRGKKRNPSKSIKSNAPPGKPPHLRVPDEGSRCRGKGERAPCESQFD